jgi:hypothetical protein
VRGDEINHEQLLTDVVNSSNKNNASAVTEEKESAEPINLEREILNEEPQNSGKFLCY